MARLPFGAQLKHAWNAFVSDNSAESLARENNYSRYYGSGSMNPSSTRMRSVSDKTLLAAIYTRMALDASGVDFRHVRLDDEEQFKEIIKSNLNECLTVEANVDQAATAFFMDVFISLFDNGFIGIVPTDTTLNPAVGGGWDVTKMRVAEILTFYPQHVRVSVYNEATGQRQEMTLPKNLVAVVYNPFYQIMNDGSSVLKRLVRKLAILDALDEKSVSGKLDILIQLPYTIRGETKENQANTRREFLEKQITDSPLGIGYIDANDKVIQLNRPVESSLNSQVEYLIQMLFSQLGLTPEIMNGTATPDAMLNYMNRTIGPLVKAVREALIRTFLTKTARTQGQTIQTFWDQWQFIPLEKMGELINSLSRNEILTANEIRPKIGFKPHSDPKANLLSNSNMPGGNNAALDAPNQDPNLDGPAPPQDNPLQPAFDSMNSQLDDAFAELGVPG